VGINQMGMSRKCLYFAKNIRKRQGMQVFVREFLAVAGKLMFKPLI